MSYATPPEEEKHEAAILLPVLLASKANASTRARARTHVRAHVVRTHACTDGRVCDGKHDGGWAEGPRLMERLWLERIAHRPRRCVRACVRTCGRT